MMMQGAKERAYFSPKRFQAALGRAIGSLKRRWCGSKVAEWGTVNSPSVACRHFGSSAAGLMRYLATCRCRAIFAFQAAFLFTRLGSLKRRSA